MFLIANVPVHLFILRTKTDYWIMPEDYETHQEGIHDQLEAIALGWGMDYEEG